MNQRAHTADRLDENHLTALGWAFLDQRTREAYRRSTGEDIAPALDRYREWVEENVVGHPDAMADQQEEAA